MPLYKRGDSKYWQVVLYVKGIEPYPFRTSTGTAEKALAEEFESRLKLDLYRQARFGERKRYTFEEGVNEWLDHTEKRSIEKDEQIIEWSLPYCKGKYLDELDVKFYRRLRRIRREQDPTKNRNWTTKRSPKQTSKKTVNRYLAFHRALLKQCVEWDMLDKAPKLPFYDEPESPEPRWITRTTFEELFLALPKPPRTPIRDVARFGVATGLRMRNMTHLTPQQVNLFARNIKIYKTTAKGKKSILIPMNDEAFAIAKKWHSKNPDRLFTQGKKNPRPIDDINTKAWRNACKEIGIEGFRVHDLRHTWATWHVTNGTPLPVLQRLGGWSTLESVEIYAEFADEYLKLYAGNSEKINNEFSGTGFESIKHL